MLVPHRAGIGAHL